MVRSHKRITRKDLRQPDQFVTITGRLFRLIQERRAAFAASLTLIVLVFLSIWGWGLYRDRQDRLAGREYSRALTLYHDSKYREALEALAKVDTYGSPTYSRLALLYQANSYIALKEPAKAEAAIQELLRKGKEDILVRQLALLTLGYIQESEGRCKEAVRSFSEAEKLQGTFKAEALLGKARCSTESRDFKQALDSYRQYLTSYPGSERKNEILLRVQQIKARIEGVGSGK